MKNPIFMASITSPLPNPKPLFFSPLRCLRASSAAVLNPSRRLNADHNTLHFAGKNVFLTAPQVRIRTKNCNAQLRRVTGAVTAEAEEEEGQGILLPDVEVKRPRNVIFTARFLGLHIPARVVVLGLHFLALLGPFQFNWGAFWVFVALYVVTGLFGITLSYHRNLSHRSFKLPKVLEYLFAYCGALALQGSPTDWVSVHRYHHQFCDSEKDPHSPLEGFWHSHMSWIFDTKSLMEKCGGRGTSNVGDLEKQSFYRFIESTYVYHPIALGVLLYALGGLPFLVWGMGVRIVFVYHITWLVNSACHVWGKQAWKTGDLSRNNWWVAVLAFGEGWHNNHHAFEYSARHGLEWWQLDMTWYVVRLLQALGLASDVKLPSDVQKNKMAFNNGSISH